MYRLHVSSRDISVGKITISDKKQINHLKNVLRAKPGEDAAASDENGFDYICKIEKISKEITLKILSRKISRKSQGPRITIACAIPKKSKMDDIIDKLAQIGVDRIIPIETERVLVKLDKAKKAQRHERWQRIAKSAAEQSQRSLLPVIEQIKTMEEVLAASRDYDLKLIPTLSGKRKSLKEAVDEVHPGNILVFIGPEGDFTDEEIDLALKSGCVPVSLGDNVLRVETAAVAVASFLKLYENN